MGRMGSDWANEWGEWGHTGRMNGANGLDLSQEINNGLLVRLESEERSLLVSRLKSD